MGKFCFGVDIGGTSVKLGMFTMKGDLINKWEIPTLPESVLSDVARSIEDRFSDDYPKEDCEGIGIDVPGPVTEDGFVSQCVNMHWGRTDVKGEIEKLTGLRAMVANDANAAALGEKWQGGGKGHESLTMVTLGTGVGGGVIIGGKIIAGSNGAAGEIGHICVNPNEEASCNCGKKGCLEQYASATGIVRLAKMEMIEGKSSTILADIDGFSAKDVLDAAKKGDAIGVDVLDKLGWYLAFACAGIAQIVDPEVFVIGGGVSKAGDIIIKAITKYYNGFTMDALKNKEFRLATLGNDAGIYGCAAMIAGKKIGYEK